MRRIGGRLFPRLRRGPLADLAPRCRRPLPLLIVEERVELVGRGRRLVQEVPAGSTK
ncbi:hypothetical protein [Lentzea albida]|uniref:hypothetical protein n=1 Tax=Lentzea albida TaxID=65499 RepID=UPI0015A62EA7|nr:hypothetical protein [Lentzea albida]